MNSKIKSSITGIILSGGKSSRMGMEKGLVGFNGKPLISYAIKTMEQLAGRILISANHSGYEQFGYEVVPDEIPDFGPLGGLLSCLNKSNSDINLVISADTPKVNASLYHYLLEHSTNSDIILPEVEPGHYEPLCAIYRLNVRDIYRKFAETGNTKIPDAFKIARFKAICVREQPFYHQNYFANINSIKDIDRFREI